jgi:hypothetical protein
MTTLLGTTGLGSNAANSNNSGIFFAIRLQALFSGTITSVGLRVGPTNPTNAHCAIYADNAGALSSATRLSGDVVNATTTANAVNTWTISPGVDVVAGQFYWLEFGASGGAFSYTDNVANPDGGTTRDTSGQTTCPTTHAATTGSFTNIFNAFADGVLADTALPPSVETPSFLTGPDAPPGFFESLLLPVQAADVVTAISDSDTGAGTETSDVQATVPGSDSSTGSEAGTVAATVAGSDSGTGTDAQTSLVIPFADSDSGTGTEAGTASVTAPGSDTSSGSESGTVSATASGSESATGSDAGTAAVTTSSTDTASGTDTGSASVSAPGSDSGTGTDGGVVTETGAGGEGGAGFDTGTVSVTASGSDSGTGTDTGTVVDTTGGPDLISGSDSGAGTELGTVLDLTPPAPPVVDTGPSGGTRVVESDYGDETAIFPVEETRRVTGTDFGVGLEAGVVVDLTPRKPLRIRLPRRAAPAPVVEPEPVETFRAVFDGDAGLATDTQALGVEVGGADVARGSETDDLQDMSEGDAEELQILALLGVL